MTITIITTITVKVDQNTEISNFEQKLFEKITFKKKEILKLFKSTSLIAHYYPFLQTRTLVLLTN